ncbi:family 16 glycosylhydrolase [Flavicella sediminum]|uniref:family 16 glycosylhydrolase n=1 Tax=Flavicella sediminum TaxID=2585141 RepID=UPI003743ABC1
MASYDAKISNNFAEEYHTYGMDWNEKELIFYFDGKEIRREKIHFVIAKHLFG